MQAAHVGVDLHGLLQIIFVQVQDHIVVIPNNVIQVCMRSRVVEYLVEGL